MEAGIISLNADVEEMKVKADKTTDEVNTLRLNYLTLVQDSVVSS